MARCDVDGARYGKRHRHRVVQMRKADAKDIAVSLQGGMAERIRLSEGMARKASVTERGCYGEQQAVLLEYQNQGVAYAMYEQFLEFAKASSPFLTSSDSILF
ncbi:MAG: hypothetical protein ACXQTR_04805 [Candidatus Methanospirareceae archaeon]